MRESPPMAEQEASTGGELRRIDAAGERREAARRPATGRRGCVQDAGRRARPVPDAAGADARAEPRDRRGGRAGHLARGPERDRPLRGPLLVADLDRQHPAQHGAHPRPARAARAAVLVPLAPAGGGSRRAGGRPRPLPVGSANPIPATGRARPPSGSLPRSASAPRRRAGSCWRRSPSSPFASAR